MKYYILKLEDHTAAIECDTFERGPHGEKIFIKDGMIKGDYTREYVLSMHQVKKDVYDEIEKESKGESDGLEPSGVIQ
jgi:hypothetical protein